MRIANRPRLSKSNKEITNYIDKKGYKRGKVGHSDLIHRQIAHNDIYLKNKDKYPLPFKKYVVHHIDRNKLNNNVSNLQIVTPEEHNKIHGIKTVNNVKNIFSFEDILNWMIIFLLVLAVVMILSNLFVNIIEGASETTSIVTKVVDGDTVEISTGEKIRLICIDTPEVGEDYYMEAKKFLESYVLGRKVKLVKDISETDKYGRLLRYMYKGSVFINGKLVENGYAKVYRYAPDTKLCDELEELQKKAKMNNLGIWFETERIEKGTDSDKLISKYTNYVCDNNFYNCGDFSSRREAQAVYEACGANIDIHKLDSDKDGIACESLP